MSMARSFVVECQFDTRAATFRKYVSATSADEAMRAAQEPGSSPLWAMEADDPRLAMTTLETKVARLEKQVDAMRSDVSSISNSDIVRRPTWTVFWGVVLGLLIWTLIPFAIALLMRR